MLSSTVPTGSAQQLSLPPLKKTGGAGVSSSASDRDVTTPRSVDNNAHAGNRVSNGRSGSRQSLPGIQADANGSGRRKSAVEDDSAAAGGDGAAVGADDGYDDDGGRGEEEEEGEEAQDEDEAEEDGADGFNEEEEDHDDAEQLPVDENSRRKKSKRGRNSTSDGGDGDVEGFDADGNRDVDGEEVDADNGGDGNGDGNGDDGNDDRDGDVEAAGDIVNKTQADIDNATATGTAVVGGETSGANGKGSTNEDRQRRIQGKKSTKQSSKKDAKRSSNRSEKEGKNSQGHHGKNVSHHHASKDSKKKSKKSTANGEGKTNKNYMGGAPAVVFTPPPSYLSNSKKENLVLEYVENFKRQYMQLYPQRKELLLSLPNEHGVMKFVCTTLRPTQLPFKELYDYRSCARFVSDFLSYDTLDPPFELPTKIPSPTHVLQQQRGNCFDYSILLTSLLRGVGYDAYVVSGYATRATTLMDETLQNAPEYQPFGVDRDPDWASFSLEFLNQDATKPTASPGNTGAVSGAKISKEPNVSERKYRIKPARQLKSSFIKRQELRAKEQQEKRESAKKKEDQKSQPDDFDELQGLRVHSWVLVLPGKREIADKFFIEPTTGKVYSTDSDRYLGIESVFSSSNYWVNMQTCFEGVKELSFALGDCTKWEFIFVEHAQPGLVTPAPGEELPTASGELSDEDDDEEKGVAILDLPPSWVAPFSITRDQFEGRVHAGKKTASYRNSKLESFGGYFRDDGLVARLTIFTDDRRVEKLEIRESYENRKDKLMQKIYKPQTSDLIEYFEDGRPQSLRQHILKDGKTREMIFSPHSRTDGLYKRVELPHKTITYFTGRDDRLIYRSVTFDGSDQQNEDGVGDGRGLIVKMAEKFERDPEIPADEDVQKRTFFVKDDRIRVVSHLGKGKIIASTRDFKKPTTENKTGVIELSTSFEVDPFAKQPKKQHLYAKLSLLLRAEQSCLQAVKSAERELHDILRTREQEESNVELTISVYDTIRNEQIPIDGSTSKDVAKTEEEGSSAHALDYLSPYMVNIANPNKLSKEDAIAIKDACLKDLKERLIEKANIIQSRIDEVTADLHGKQSWYQKNQDTLTKEEEDAYIAYCNEATFRIHTMEARLSRHKETAPERYIAMDKRVRNDPRIAAVL